jgi:hypothetical protein
MPDMVWVPDRQWRTPSHYSRCRMLGCTAPPVADLRRGHKGHRPRWWAYCADHLYGRRVGPSGEVLTQVCADSPAAERGYVGAP